ncbi:MAG: lipid-binding SYLF domain-containing protein [Alphaproteobacteria bacterium]|nr:lipid-binding SYLF domain-containing protein [Alphaproteobacteria bacterium]
MPPPWFAALLGAFLQLALPQHAWGQATEHQALVDKAALSFRAVSQEPSSQAYIKRAKALLIVPSYVKAGFFLGGEGGSGVLVARRGGGWSDPAFYTIAGGSIGIQIGVEAKEIVFAIMTDKGLNAVMSNQVKVGADVSIAVGTVGAGAEAATVGSRNVDIYAFSKSVGLFGGGALEGTLIAPRQEWNNQYYGQTVTPRQIIFEGRVRSAGARALHESLSGY